MEQMEVLLLDVYGNSKDWYINDCFHTGDYLEIENAITKRKLFRAICEAGYDVPKGCIVIEDNEHIIEVYRRNGMPLLFLQGKEEGIL